MMPVHIKCTGDYVIFWKEFYDSFQKYFLPKSWKDYFVFTDVMDLYAQDYKTYNLLISLHAILDNCLYIELIPFFSMPVFAAVGKVYQKNLGWPGNTLKRFQIFRKIEEKLSAFDYIYFFNSNLICQEVITEDEFLPRENGDMEYHNSLDNNTMVPIP